VLASGVTSSDYQGVTTEEGKPISTSSSMDGVRVLNGSLEVGGRSGSELSWEFQDFVEVKVRSSACGVARFIDLQWPVSTV
jgi:hypothetical protein